MDVSFSSSEFAATIERTVGLCKVSDSMHESNLTRKIMYKKMKFLVIFSFETGSIGLENAHIGKGPAWASLTTVAGYKVAGTYIQGDQK